MYGKPLSPEEILNVGAGAGFRPLGAGDDFEGRDGPNAEPNLIAETRPMHDFPGDKPWPDRDKPDAGASQGNAEGAEESDCLDEWNAGAMLRGPKPKPRRWILGNQFARKFVSGLTAPGATGKSATRLAQYMAAASAVEVTGEHVFARTRVLLISMEDDREELERRIWAAALHYGIDPDLLDGWLYCWTPKGIKLAGMKDEIMQKGRLETLIRDKIRNRDIGLVALDPFIKVHSLGENDNNAMDYVCELLTKIAIDLNVAVDIPMHTRKGPQVAGNSDSGRGASATRDAGRLFKTLTRMSDDEAKQFGIGGEHRLLYVRLDNAKVNIAPPAEGATWFKLIGVKLDNGDAEHPAGDDVQTVERWYPPKTWDGVSVVQLNAILTDIDAGMENGQRYSGASAAKGERAAWLLIQRHAPDRTEPQCREIIRTWLKNGVLLEEEYNDPVERKPRKGLSVCDAKRPT